MVPEAQYGGRMIPEPIFIILIMFMSLYYLYRIIEICIEIISPNKFDGTWKCCPECKCKGTIKDMDDFIEDGYRVCEKCDCEWYTSVDYSK